MLSRKNTVLPIVNRRVDWESLECKGMTVSVGVPRKLWLPEKLLRTQYWCKERLYDINNSDRRLPNFVIMNVWIRIMCLKNSITCCVVCGEILDIYLSQSSLSYDRNAILSVVHFVWIELHLSIDSQIESYKVVCFLCKLARSHFTTVLFILYGRSLTYSLLWKEHLLFYVFGYIVCSYWVQENWSSFISRQKLWSISPLVKCICFTHCSLCRIECK